MNIRTVEGTISVAELREIAKEFYQSMIKGAVDVKSEIIAFGGEYHIDAGNVLAAQGSRPEYIWGFNIRLNEPRDSWIEYTALINIKPQQGNRGMLIEDGVLRNTIRNILEKKIV